MNNLVIHSKEMKMFARYDENPTDKTRAVSNFAAYFNSYLATVKKSRIWIRGKDGAYREGKK